MLPFLLLAQLQMLRNYILRNEHNQSFPGHDRYPIQITKFSNKSWGKVGMAHGESEDLEKIGNIKGKSYKVI